MFLPFLLFRVNASSEQSLQARSALLKKLLANVQTVIISLPLSDFKLPLLCLAMKLPPNPLAQRQLPAEGLDDFSIELLLMELASIDSNNFLGEFLRGPGTVCVERNSNRHVLGF